jgi:hypothetical protein
MIHFLRVANLTNLHKYKTFLSNFYLVRLTKKLLFLILNLAFFSKNLTILQLSF